MDVVVFPLNIHLGEVFHSLQFVNEGGDEGKQICILDHVFIEISIILARVKFFVFFLNKEEQRGLRQLRFSDFTRFEVFFNELLACLPLLGIHGIGFSYLQDEGFFEINGMVKGSLRGEFPVLRLIEDFGVLRVLWGKFPFHFLCSLSQGSGEGELSDVGVVFHQHPSKHGHVPLLGVDSGNIFGFVPFYCSQVS